MSVPSLSERRAAGVGRSLGHGGTPQSCFHDAVYYGDLMFFPVKGSQYTLYSVARCPRREVHGMVDAGEPRMYAYRA
ncbi:hypothetical protein NDU88_002361 [Pleurodeles waltl]|uniref:Uncharacterized protein n=1 Tax=Pleurodeles waltl TaxID=8319 RepID=A0AAV7M0B9_PLEWA|nr:hypothetical protein NDU88_002361 [Pleurodeles waltl]